VFKAKETRDMNTKNYLSPILHVLKIKAPHRIKDIVLLLLIVLTAMM
jgi:hypothetical protein